MDRRSQCREDGSSAAHDSTSRCHGATCSEPAFWEGVRRFRNEVVWHQRTDATHFAPSAPSTPPADQVDFDQRIVGEPGDADAGSRRQSVRRMPLPQILCPSNRKQSPRCQPLLLRLRHTAGPWRTLLNCRRPTLHRVLPQPTILRLICIS